MTAQRNAIGRMQPCRYCGNTVYAFKDELGCWRYLEPHEPASTVVLPEGHTWEQSVFRTVGWYLLDVPRRSHRPLRIEHLCEGNLKRLQGK